MISIRPAKASDAASVIEIRNRAFDTPLSNWLESSLPINLIEAEVSQYATFAKGNKQYFMACDSTGKVVGYMGFSVKGSDVRKDPSWLGQLDAWLFALQAYLYNIILYLKSRQQLLERKQKMNRFITEIEADLEETVRKLGLDKFVYVESLAVDPDTHKGGIGSKLLQKAIDEAISQNMPLILESNSRAVDFYLKKGFKLLGKPFEFWADGKHLGTWPNMILERD